MVEDNGTKENGPNLGKKMELEKESKKLEETILSKENDKFAYLCHFPQHIKNREQETRPQKYWKC